MQSHPIAGLVQRVKDGRVTKDCLQEPLLVRRELLDVLADQHASHLRNDSTQLLNFVLIIDELLVRVPLLRDCLQIVLQRLDLQSQGHRLSRLLLLTVLGS